ncbi:MAG: cation diffusion facilitator family transporter [Bacteroidales bacterium]|jgi:cation diffusion facilitator family transporter|nr:cation diffusion facilitator family transporter [Bacteroidales bacterium]
MEDSTLHKNQRKTSWVIAITALTMLAEIFFGLSSGSMALLADGIHMGSHVLAIGLSWLAYLIVRRITAKNPDNAEKTDKILSFSGYNSGLILLVFAGIILAEAIGRINNPVDINFREAILVAIIGLVVNIVSAVLLHNDKSHSDHNLRAAYLHVLADALTSLSAIAGLTAAMIWEIAYIDSIAAILSSIVIVVWSVGLLKASGKVLLDLK